jgi:hypothetical protein
MYVTHMIQNKHEHVAEVVLTQCDPDGTLNTHPSLVCCPFSGSFVCFAACAFCANK